MENFEKKLKEIKIEGKRKVSSSAMYTEHLPRTHYTEVEIEAMYMGKDSEARKRLQRNNSVNRKIQSAHIFLVGSHAIEVISPLNNLSFKSMMTVLKVFVTISFEDATDSNFNSESVNR